MLRIATVDDNPADLKEIRMCLSHYFQKRAGQTPIDYTISAYTSGPSFLENFGKGDYDLILLDIYMPRMTGIQVAEAIRAIDEDAWIIFLTTSRDHALESYNVFASGYVLKPLLENAPQLETLLTRLLPEDALILGFDDLGADGGAQAEAHGAEAAGGQQLAGIIKV